jgi:hypothetical protein
MANSRPVTIAATTAAAAILALEAMLLVSL